MHEFIIAIKISNPDYWLKLEDKFPMEEEVLKDFYIFQIKAKDLKQAVVISQAKRKIRNAKSNYELNNEVSN